MKMEKKVQDFIDKVELNRGVYKNKEKSYMQLHNIYYESNERFKKLFTEGKNFGIALGEEISTNLNSDEQDLLINEVFESNGSSTKVSHWKEIYNRIMMER